MSHEVASKKKKKKKKVRVFFFFNLRRKKVLGNFKEGVITFVSHLFAPSFVTLEE